MLGSYTPGHGQAGPGRAEFASDALDSLDCEAGLLCRHPGRIAGEHTRQLATTTPLPGDDVRHGKSERRLRARSNGEPLVRVESGEIHPGTGIDEFGQFA